MAFQAGEIVSDSTPTIALLDEPNGQPTGDFLPKGKAVSILVGDPPDAAVPQWLAVEATNDLGELCLGWVLAQSIRTLSTNTGIPGPLNDASTSLDAAMRAGLRANEIGPASPYKLSYARLGVSGASFGIFQGDVNVNKTARDVLRAVLNGAQVDANRIDHIISLVARPCPNGSPLNSADANDVDQALSSAQGRAKVDAMDDQIFHLVRANVSLCVDAARKANIVIAPAAQIAIALWVNMSGAPTALRSWLSGSRINGVAPPSAPIATRENIEVYLRATEYFSSHPRNFVHFSESVDAGVRLLPKSVVPDANAHWTYVQRTGNMHHVVNGATITTLSGYSGNGAGENNPDMQFVKMTGPLPQGMYTIGAPQPFKKMSNCLLLSPDPDNDMEGRSEFLIHDGNVSHGKTSEGCICMHMPDRLTIWNSGDHRLKVVGEENAVG